MTTIVELFQAHRDDEAIARAQELHDFFDAGPYRSRYPRRHVCHADHEGHCARCGGPAEVTS